MLWSETASGRRNGVLALICAGMVLAACQFRPLHGDTGTNPSVGASNLSSVTVSQVNTRVAQQVRNHLLFLMNGGISSAEKTHEARIRVSWTNRQLANITGIADSSAGTVTVTVDYVLVELATGKTIATGARRADASYDRTGQVFANRRAERDAENRAAREAAEALRLAIAGKLARELRS